MSDFGKLRVAWLQAFVAVAEGGKGTAAAAEMRVQQSSVSRNVKSLEAWLGGRLLFTGRGPVQLAPDGERLLPIAKKVLELLQEAKTPPPVEPRQRVSGKGIQLP